MKFKWEEVESNFNFKERTYKAAVLGGWLIRIVTSDETHLITYVPDDTRRSHDNSIN
jgi:hypothetical protein